MKSVRGYFSITLGVLILCFILLVNIVPAFSQTASITIFGPKQYDKPKGKPVTYTDTFQAASTTGIYTLWVQSGAEGLNEVKNVSVSVNGVEIIDSQDLRNNNPASKVISVQSTNTLSVTLKGQGGNYITVKVLCEGCFPSVTDIIPPEGGTITLEGYASVTFPAGAFTSSQNVTISVTSSPETQKDYNEWVKVGVAGPRLQYEIRINFGSIAPATTIDAVLYVPDAFLNILPQNAKIEVFADMIFATENELLGGLEGISPIYDPTTKSVRVTLLPNEAFLLTANGTYEAIIVVGSELR